MDDHETACLNFLQTTGTDDIQVARNYVEMAGGDLNQAVSLYFEMGTTQAPPTTQTSRPLRPAPAESEDIRSPVAAFNERLLHGHQVLDPNSVGGLSNDAVVTNSLTNFNPSPSKADPIAKLYAPPIELNCWDNFEVAQQAAKEESKLILVNIQKDDEFLSHRLNSDVWNKPEIRDLLGQSYLFWQRSNNSNDGQYFINLYGVYKFPYVAVVCPRTRAVLKSWDANTLLRHAGAALNELWDVVGEEAPRPRRHVANGNALRARGGIPASDNPPESESGSTQMPSATATESEASDMPLSPGRVLGRASENEKTSYTNMNSLLGDLHKQRRRGA